MADTTPKLGPITRSNGVAGQFSLTVEATYPGEPAAAVTFVGSTFGGPVLMQTTGNPDGTFITDPGRFGEFGTAWVQRFFGES